MNKIGLVTSYHSSNQDYITTISNLTLKPLVTALGREVKITLLKDGTHYFTAAKVQSIALRIVAALGAIILFPITFVGLALRYCSAQQKQNLSAELKFDDHLKNLRIEADEIMANSQKSAAASVDIKTRLELLKGLSSLVYRIQYLDAEKTIQIITEFKNQLNQWIGKPFFTKDLSYEDALQLKKLFSQLAQNQNKVDSEEWAQFPFKIYHKQAHTFYYENFAVQHLLRNLSEKESITALNLSLKDLNSLKEPKEDVIQGILEAYKDQEVIPSQVTWVHGTNSSTIVGMLHANGLLKPGGKIQEEGDLAFAGEHDKGAFGINMEFISGVSLKDNEDAIAYATGGLGLNDTLGPICASKPLEAIDAFVQWANDFSKNIKANYWQIHLEYTHHAAIKANLYNWHRYMKIVCSLESEAFQNKLLPAIESAIAKCDEALKNEDPKSQTFAAIVSIRDKMLAPVLAFKNSSKHYSSMEKALINDSFPMVLGATKLQLVKEGESQTGKSAKMISKINSLVAGEYVHKGSLLLGTDLPFIFVPKSRVQQMRDYLQVNGIQNVRVCGIGALKIAPYYQLFKKIQLEKV